VAGGDREDLQEALRVALAEHEVATGYSVQNIKKAAFELQSKHTSVQLDSKKAHLALQAIQKKCLQLTGDHERSPVRSRVSSLNRESSNLMSPTTSSGHSNKLAGEIARQTEVLGRSLAVIQDKLTGCEVHIQYLMQDAEEEQTANTHKLRVSLEQCLARPIDDSFNLNAAKLQSDLDQALKQIHQL